MEQVSGLTKGRAVLPAVLVRIFLGSGSVLLKTLGGWVCSITYLWEIPGRWQNASNDLGQWQPPNLWSPWKVLRDWFLLNPSWSLLHGTWTQVLLLLLSQSCPQKPSGLHCVWIRLEFKVGRNFWDNQLNLLYFPCLFGNLRDRMIRITPFPTAAHQGALPPEHSST